MRAVPAAVPCARADGRAGKAGGLVRGVEVKRSVTIAAVPEQVRAARAFVAGVLGSTRTFARRCC